MSQDVEVQVFSAAPIVNEFEVSKNEAALPYPSQNKKELRNRFRSSLSKILELGI